jgi:sulfite exporter TauE/SafE
VLALPGHQQSIAQRWLNRLNYHLGRVLVYALLGGLAGVIGHGITLFTWQRSVAIAGGTLMVLLAVVPKITHRIGMPEPLRKPIDEARSGLYRKLKSGHLFTWVGLGALNGLLPCGPLYIALAGALAAGTWQGGALFMMLFGLGTAVALSALHFVRDKAQPFTRRLAPVLTWATAIVGILLVLRGLDLGIPFLSPSQTIVMGTAAGCH